MIDVRNSDEVLSLLGQPSLEAIGQSVARTRDDLDEYRRAVPRLAARQTQRGILNWIHDQLFANVRDLFEAHVSSVQVRDVEPRREIYVTDLFRLRFKKHGPADLVSSYPTEAFKDFIVQDPPQLLQEIRLIGGFRWDAEARLIGPAVLSARDGNHNVLWVIELVAETGGTTVLTPVPSTPSPGPSLPVVAFDGKLLIKGGTAKATS